MGILGAIGGAVAVATALGLRAAHASAGAVHVLAALSFALAVMIEGEP